jgi:hypothetical protein
MRSALTAATTLVALAFLAPVAAAQDQGQVEAARLAIETERTAVITANLPLTDAEGQAFWPVQREYRAEVRQLNDRTLALLKEFGANYNAATDQQASDMLKAALKIEEDRVKLWKKYQGRFEKALPPKKVARYYQIEHKMDAAIAYQMAEAIPLVKN